MPQMIQYIDERIRFLVEETQFFTSNFLVKEGFIQKKLFTGMFGVVGLAEAVNTLLGAEKQSDRFGYSEKANKLGEQLKGIKNAAENLKKPIALSTFLRFAKPQKTGGSVETELTEQEIQDLIAQGYVIEQV